MLSKWGTYPWFSEHGYDKIHPEDLENFMKEANNTKVFKCVDEGINYITLKYQDKLYRVKRDLYKGIPKPKFQFGQKVKIIDKKSDNITITDIMWHYEKKEHFYFVKVDGKKKSKRYFEQEFNT